MQHHSSAVASQVQPPLLWLLQWQKILPVWQVTRYFGEGTTQVKTYWEHEKRISLSFCPEVTERQQD